MTRTAKPSEENKTERPDDHKPLETLEIELLLTGVSRHYGYDFRGYAPASMRRRIQRFMNHERLATISRLQDRVLHDEAAFGRFIDAVSVRVTEMFRDGDVYKHIRDEVLPVLRTYPFVRIWHAGCAGGEEVYSLAILLHECGLLEKSRIYATDLTDVGLERAAAGRFDIDKMRGFTQAYHAAGGTQDFSSYYRVTDKHVIFDPMLRKRMVFSQHNLVSDSAFNEFNLVFCRNVLIYFGDDLRARVFNLLDESLVRLGVLVLGNRESLRFSPIFDRYETIDDNLKIYRKQSD